jgi:hypothetical protein
LQDVLSAYERPEHPRMTRDAWGFPAIQPLVGNEWLNTAHPAHAVSVVRDLGAGHVPAGKSKDNSA